MNNGKYYVGSTRDIKERIERHIRGGVNSTKKYLPVFLKYFRKYETIDKAIVQEKYLKRMKSRIIIEKFILGL